MATLSSSSIKKCYTVLFSGFSTAKKWHCEIPDVAVPSEKTVKRKAWDAQKAYEIMESIKDQGLLHRVVHLAFVCLLRAGEVAGIDLQTINLSEGSLRIARQVQRVSGRALAELPKNEIIRVFPKQTARSKSSLILKAPKTEGSHRKQHLTEPLLLEIKKRLAQIQMHKDFFGEEYKDYSLLICQPDGRLIDPNQLEKNFKVHQRMLGIEEKDQIEFQGLQKSGQMHKVRLTRNNYQLVAESAGQSPEVLMSNYNKALDSEKRALAKLVEGSFYPDAQKSNPNTSDAVSALLKRIEQDSALRRQILQNLLRSQLQAEQTA